MAVKEPGPFKDELDGSSLRIAIVHARWNIFAVNPLVEGAKKALIKHGVMPENIFIESVQGSWELPFSIYKIIEASKLQADQCLKSSEIDKQKTPSTSFEQKNVETLTQIKGEFDAVIAIGVLIKGETMHFEYISDSVSHGLMKVQLDTGIPIVFGVLTVLNKEQALERAGVSGELRKNHGEDWGFVAVELGVKRKKWKNGEL
ncbi:6,7-dimethyl-8-ribityllumazine synthase [Pneumocystis carinii B80]|uniref:6,7-dimethyl-8-ribityllumazine synthase n=1 Tax=Pneumocystis carinii (strain B80) TaxID=1408658 RepID=A0A0W4ZP33_PNEC8|nr:6,7-dimethyl-8-ribityllumazine synthase [Pneumocystis carinii B80]KTW30133.1 6,7-dimethyl-8-ribityllumazine synthase [Pneumocystis carinii B80]